MTTSANGNELADQVAEAVLAHPCVVRLDGGEHGVVVTHLPGRKIIGVRLGEQGEPMEVALVLRFGRPVLDVVSEVRARVESVAGPVSVDITVSDLDGTGHSSSTPDVS